MPPRRSSRSRASVEPTPIAPPTSKRKRGSPDENKAPLSTDSTTTRGGRSAAKGRAVSSRVSKALQDVRESDEEGDEEEQSRPVKKSRPSLENAEPEEEPEEEEVKPARGRKAPARRVTSTRRGKAPVKVEDDSDEEVPVVPSESEEEQKPRGGRRRAVKKIESSDDEFEEDKPTRKGRGGSVARGTSSRGRGGRAAAAPKASSSSRKRVSRASVATEDEESEEKEVEVKQTEDEAATQDGNESDALSYLEDPASGRAAQQVQKVPTEPVIQEAEEEEERSLLDPAVPLSAPPLSMAPQPRAVVVEEPQGPKSRLVIHKMALVNFKSYAGRQEIGPFHKSFSSIVGPNGSGKSNTIDALLFVFGYRASKMRQGKLSELIHNSARHPDLDECSVEVHFRDIIDLPGPDEFEIVPDSSLVVARTAYKNNSSRYTINGRQSNYKEVQGLLKGRGIDLDHNRFLILQGEVESIAQMKPKAPTEHEDGLLEYLEDIIGTSKFKEPIEEALQEMDKFNEERGEKLNRLKIVERERNALEAEKKEAEDYLRLYNEHVKALSRLWQYYLWTCLKLEDKLKDELAVAERELKAETERNQDDITHLEQLQEHYKEKCDVYEEVKSAAAAALKELALNEKQQVSLEEKRKHAKTKLKKLQKTVADDEKARNEALRAITDNGNKITKEKKKLADFESSLADEERVLEQIRDSLKDKTQVYHDQIEVKQKELQPWTAKINAKRAEIDVATSERDMLAKKAEEAQKASENAQTELDQLREDQEAKVAERDELKQTRASKVQELKDGQKRLQDIQARVQQLRGKASSSRQRADEAKASQAANTSQNKVLDTLTKLKNAGRISGFHGRLGSLGTIPEKYDVAVSTACGALNNLVVDLVEQGQQCIEYLRKQNVGRASFLVLEKLSNNNLDKIQTPENVPRLFDLIKPKDPKFAPAFYKGVGNTLVADDLEQANRIAFGGSRRWRVVTLAGQLIDASGTMSGGGNHVQRGGMSSKLTADAVSPETLRKYEQDSEAAAQELDAASQQLREIERELDSLSHSGPQIDMAIEKVGLDIQTLTRRIADAEKRVKELRGHNKVDSRDVARISALESTIASATKELNKLEEKTAAIEKDIKTLEGKILEIGGSRLLAQKSKVDGIRLHINLANEEITKAEVAKAKAERDSKKLATSLEANTASLEEISEDLETLESSLEEVNQYVQKLQSTVRDAQAAEENQKDALETLKTQLDEKTDEIQAFRKKEMELQQTISDRKKELADNDKHLGHWQTKHDKLKLREVDDEDDEEEEENQPQGDTAEGSSNPVKPDPDAPKKNRESSLELKIYSVEELSVFSKRDLMADAELLDEQIKNMKPNLEVLKDYKKREEEFMRRAQDLDEVTRQRDEQKKRYEDLRKQRLDEFMTGFNTISLKLKEMYQMITLGGNAELELVDSMDPFSEGIIFSVMPPKKSWRNISNLSGGEKTLSSLALVFALHVYKPTPLYFMDEIDAALDFRNVSIVANYIKDRTKNAQFIIISLRNDMFELSHRLIGIYKTSNATRSISIDNRNLHTVPITASVQPVH